MPDDCEAFAHCGMGVGMPASAIGLFAWLFRSGLSLLLAGLGSFDGLSSSHSHGISDSDNVGRICQTRKWALNRGCHTLSNKPL